MQGALNKGATIFLLFLLVPFIIKAQEELQSEIFDENSELSDFFFAGEDAGFDQNDDYTRQELMEIKRIAQEKMDIGVTDNRDWWYLLKKGKLNLGDTTVVYPKFLKFCVNVYNWADHFFNGFDKEYVEGTGYRWKARLINENWTDSYALRFRHSGENIRMLSNLNDNIGAYLQYMAVSIGYSVDLNTIFSGKKTDHTRFETNFSCALFNFDLYYYHSTGTKIRRFSEFENNRLVNIDFPGVTSNNFGVSLYYFLNNKKYSQGAAYNFARYQRKSAGSWMFGLTYSNLNIAMNFRELPADLQPFFSFPSSELHLHYNSYCALFGYGYNWVIHPKWLFNITAMPSIGFNHCYEDSSDGRGYQFALNIHGRTSITYNHKALFCSLIGKITGNWYISKNLSLFNAVEYFSLNAGFRF